MTLLLVPPDTRPPTRDFPVALAQAAGLDPLTPPKDALPVLNQPGNHEVLADWLRAHVGSADTLILSLETLCLGGMIPARRVNDALDTVLKRLELLTELKRLNPALTILAGGVVVRVAHDDDPLEEKPYYGEHGAALRFYSEAFDRYTLLQTADDEKRLARAVAGVPEGVLEDWLTTRKRNHQMHLRALELVHEGVINHLCLTLDDTSLYGLAAHDRRALDARTDALGIWPKVDIYPGADEVPVTLLARALQKEPTKVYVRCPSLSGETAQLLYEDRPVGELVRAHLRAAGCVRVDTLSEADVVLAVNTPASKQASRQPDHATVDTAARHLPEFMDFIARCLDENKAVSVADIAYANGAEERLMKLLDSRVRFADLAGFSAWNTAGNTLGGAIALGLVSSRVVNRAAWVETLFNRFVDDYLYQTKVREDVRDKLVNPSPFDLGSQREEAEELMGLFIEPLAQGLWEKHFSGLGLNLTWEAPRLAWPRLFTGVFPFRVLEEG